MAELRRFLEMVRLGNEQRKAEVWRGSRAEDATRCGSVRLNLYKMPGIL